MAGKKAPEMSEGVFSVGVRDPERRIFDALIPLPEGTSYNSYLILGKDKTALIDTVNPGFEKALEDNISELTDFKKIDYIIMNHAEPDHAGAIPFLMNKNRKAILVASKKGAEVASTYYKIPADRIRAVNNGDKINLGGKSLEFIEAPWLHWPETMFTFLVEDKILFPCDFFGSHLSGGDYDSDVKDLDSQAKRYFGEIMMPFRAMGKKALDKLKGYDIAMIAPSHGPIYRKPERILENYRKWTGGKTEKKVVIVYASMWKSTEKMIFRISEKMKKEGVEACIHDLSTADIGDIARDLVDSPAIILGAPAFLGGMHPLAVYAAYLVKALRPPLKYGAVLSSFGWGGGALKQAVDTLGPTGIEIVGSLEIKGPPAPADLRKIDDIGVKLASRILG